MLPPHVQAPVDNLAQIAEHLRVIKIMGGVVCLMLLLILLQMMGSRGNLAMYLKRILALMTPPPGP